MRPPDRRGWRGGVWTGGARPLWWPENEPFPPTRDAWRRARVRHPPRYALMFCGMFLIFSLVVAAFITLLVNAFSALTSGGGLAAFAPLAILAALVFAIGAGTVGRLSRPVADLVDAAERIEAGDYAVRVRARGPRTLRSLGTAFNSMSERLESSERERRRLLADVTHELRTPLTVMQGNLEALLDGVYPADNEHLEPILDETRVLSRLVDDLRTLSMAEAGALALHRETTSIGELVTDSVAPFRAQADAAGITLGAVTEGELPHVDVDPVRIREVLTNLLSNALRFTPRGGSVHITGAASGGQVVISVSDTGPGIAPDALPHVFERFYKSADSRGAGLGLAIAKGLVDAHGGTIEAKSTLGRGTEMRITLPV